MNQEQNDFIKALQDIAEQLENVCRSADVAQVFAEEVKPCTNLPGEILNVEIGVSFQSDEPGVKPVYCLSNMRIGSRFFCKHIKPGEWKEDY